MELLDSISASILSAALLAAAISLAAVFLSIWLAKRAGLMDIPGAAPHKQHARPTPLAGGLTLAITLTALFFLFQYWQEPRIAWLLAGAGVIFTFGLLDDRKALRAFPKLGGQVLAALILVLSGTSIQILKNPPLAGLGLPWLASALNIALTFFWIIGITNALNLVDSMDGLAVSLSGLAFAFFTLGALVSGQAQLAVFLAALSGIALVLYFFNAPPARLFLGDSGAQTLGFLLAGAAILYNPLDKAQASSWFLPILFCGVPIFDTCLVFFSRLRRKLPFYRAGLDHTYHRLVRLGLSPAHAVRVMVFAAVLLDTLAFLAINLPPLAANAVFFACLLAGASLIVYLDRPKFTP